MKVHPQLSLSELSNFLTITIICSVLMPSHAFCLSSQQSFSFYSLSFIFSLLPAKKPQAFNCTPPPPLFKIILHLDKWRWNVVSFCAWCTSSVFLRHSSPSFSTRIFSASNKANRNRTQNGGISAHKGKRKHRHKSLDSAQSPHSAFYSKNMRSTCVGHKFGVASLFI